MEGGSNGGLLPPSRPRIVAGMALIFASIVLTFWDASSVEFKMDSVQLGLLLGSGMLLLGVEAAKRLLR